MARTVKMNENLTYKFLYLLHQSDVFFPFHIFYLSYFESNLSDVMRILFFFSDIDECVLKTDKCSACQICNNTEGSFTCIFASNYNTYLRTLNYPICNARDKPKRSLYFLQIFQTAVTTNDHKKSHRLKN